MRASNVRYARRTDGGAVAVEFAGDRGGPPVLFCHGLADSRRSVRLLDQAARALGVCVIAPDRPGVGLSDLRSLERVSDCVQDAAVVLDALGLDRTVVLGISGGGPFAAACAAALPERVSALVLVSSLEPRRRGHAIGVTGCRRSSSLAGNDAGLQRVAAPGSATCASE